MDSENYVYILTIFYSVDCKLKMYLMCICFVIVDEIEANMHCYMCILNFWFIAMFTTIINVFTRCTIKLLSTCTWVSLSPYVHGSILSLCTLMFMYTFFANNIHVHIFDSKMKKFLYRYSIKLQEYLFSIVL